MAQTFYALLKKHKIDKNKKFLIKKGDSSILGPYNAAQMAELIKRGDVKEEDYVSEYPREKWHNIALHPLFYDIILYILDEGEIPLKRKTELKKIVKNPQLEKEEKTEKLKTLEKPQGEKTVVQKVIPPEKAPHKPKQAAPKRKKILFLSLLVIIGIYFLTQKKEESSYLIIELPPQKVEKINVEEGDSLFGEGLQYYSEDNFSGYKKAVKLFLGSLKNNPDQPGKALSYLFLTYSELWDLTSQRKEDKEKLLELLTRIQSGNSQFVEYFITNALFEIKITKDLFQASKILKEALQKYSKSAYLNYLLGIVALEDKDTMAALQYFDKSIQLDSSFIKAYFEKAKLYLVRNNIQLAEESFQEALDIKPDHIGTQLELSIIQYLHRKELSVARDNLKNILEKKDMLFPTQTAKAYFYLGKIFQDIKSFDLALKNYKLALVYDPKNTLYNEAYTQLSAGGELALPDFHKQDLSYFINLGQIHLKQKEYHTALQKFQIAQALDSKNFEPYYYLGEIYSHTETRNVEKAIEAYENAVRFKANHGPSYLSLAHLYLEQYNLKKAKDLLRRSEKLVSDTAEFHFTSALLFERGGQSERALNEYEKTLSINNAHEEALWSLASLWTQKKDYGKAEVYLKRLIQIQPENYKAYVKLAEYKLLQGFPQSALSYLQNLIKNSPHNAVFYAGLGKIYFLSDKQKLAAEEMTKALGKDSQNIFVQEIVAEYYKSQGNRILAYGALKNMQTLQKYKTSLYYDAAQLLVEEAQNTFSNSVCGEYRKQCELNKILLPQNICVHLLKSCHDENGNEVLSKMRTLYQEAHNNLQTLIGTPHKQGLNPQYPEAHFLMGEIYSGMGEATASIKEYQKEIEINKQTENNIDLSIVYLKLGDSYYFSNRYKDAIQNYAKAIQMNRDLEGAYLKLGVSHFFSNQFDVAESYLQTAKKHQPEEPQIYYFLAQIYKYKDQKDQTIEALSDFLRVDPLTPLRSIIAQEIEDLKKF
ncbi:MAG: tetratricopeptide repeat protein [Deltaproteobacteria bacterium]|nr:tetratricopeptide repeat protein [Deltaproteobacteria bacterium]